MADEKTPHYYLFAPGHDVLDCLQQMSLEEARGCCRGFVLKYGRRAGHKTADPLPDLKKCAHVLERWIAIEEAGAGYVPLDGGTIVGPPENLPPESMNDSRDDVLRDIRMANYQVIKRLEALAATREPNWQEIYNLATQVHDLVTLRFDGVRNAR
jgi:hypothetical protein